jgi:hypothetical protein
MCATREEGGGCRWRDMIFDASKSRNDELDAQVFIVLMLFLLRGRLSHFVACLPVYLP